MRRRFYRQIRMLAIACAAFILFYGCKSTQSTTQQKIGKEQAMVGSSSDSFPPPPPGGTPPSGNPPQGMPPGGTPPNGMPPGGGPGGQFDASLIAAVWSAKDENLTKTNESIEAQAENQSAVVAFEKTEVVLQGNKITTSGNTSSNDQSSFQGLNAAVLGRDESTVKMSNNVITTTGEGANAIFAYGKSVIYSSNDIIDCTAGGAHGIMTSGGGTIEAENVKIITRGRNSGAVATDRGSGTITVKGGAIKATGADSPGVYSTGKISVSDATITATGAEVAVIEGSNSIITENCDLLCSFQNKWGVMIYQSFSGDAEGVDGHFEMNGGSLKCADKQGPLFFVTNSNANIYLNDVTVEVASGILLNAGANRWGRTGNNGGNANIYANAQHLQGDVLADTISTVSLSLQNGSLYEGNINPDQKAKKASVTLDKTSRWAVTKDSYVSEIQVDITGSQVLNIEGNGHTVWYKQTENTGLNGKTYSLKNGGMLKPYR